jgi:cytochrome P450
MHSFLSHLLPSYWSGKAYLRTGTELLSPKIADLIHKNDKGTWSPGENVDDVNVLSWLADTAKGKDRDPGTLAHVEVLLALASVHTTLLRMVNVLYDLTCHPEYLPGLHEEIETERETGWNASSYTKLRKLDSVLRESQRISPPTILGMKRLFKQDFTFANGLHIRKGTYVCMPTFAIENDASNTSKPQEFDGLRSYRLREELGDPNREEHQFSSYEKTVLNFGYGKAACPGRYFASLILKMVFVKLLTEYDFEFLPNTGRPKNVVLHEFLFPWPWDRILIRKKRGHSSPF